MKPGDRVIWLRSPRHCYLTGWRVKRVPGVIEQVYPNCIRIRVWLEGKERLVNVSRDSIICDEDG